MTQATESERTPERPFPLGPQDGSWEPEFSGPKSTVPGSSAWSPFLGQEKHRMILLHKTLPLPWPLLPGPVQGRQTPGEAHSPLEKQH